MRLPYFLLHRLARLADSVPARRAPDFVIGDDPEAPYLRRWWLIPRNRFFNIYLHQFCRSDDDRALHSHPWLFNASILLRGRYVDHTPRGAVTRHAGDFAGRWGNSWHRVQLLPPVPAWVAREMADTMPLAPCWTIFITGPRIREWGFACPHGFVHWRDFTARGSGGAVTGPACDAPASAPLPAGVEGSR